MAKAKNRGPKRVARGHDYLIADRALLAKVVGDEIHNQFEGNTYRASQACGIPNSSLRGYATGRVHTLRHESVERLRRLVGPSMWSKLEQALLSSVARRRLAAYDAWIFLETMIAAAGPSATVRLLASNKSQKSRQAQKATRFSAESLEVFRRRNAAMDVVARLRLQFPAQWSVLDRRLKQRGHFQPRGELAQLRIVAPLLSSMDSGFVERSLKELEASPDLRQFLEAGIKRECILLDRETDIRRSQESTYPPTPQG